MKNEKPKRCTECGKIIRPWNKSGLCRYHWIQRYNKNYMKEYQKKNKDKIAQNSKRYYQKNKEKKLAYQREYYKRKKLKKKIKFVTTKK